MNINKKLDNFDKSKLILDMALKKKEAINIHVFNKDYTYMTI